ncbi:two-component system sensor histidine kinase NtrB [Planctomycetes bacterium K23_9]|uniref:histidine kinase n=1 Tax=Stieleria marina TaxID=1930275 RepID=A0A517NZG1_9BACT|nr:Sensor protein ZraS [Planctomycetes bacterium K23_9]
MFSADDSRSVRRFAIGLAILSLLTLSVTAWIWINVRHEQQIVGQLIGHLRGNDFEVAEELQSELSVQSELSLLLVLNAIATAVVLSFVVRGYFSSQRSLRDAKELSADILASMDSGVITTDQEGTIISVNPRGEQLVGLESRAPQISISDVHSQHSLLCEITEAVQKYGQPIRDRDYHVTNDGHTRTLRAGCTVLRSRDGENVGLVIHVRDVSERRLMEERLRRMERYMSLGSLAAGLQHEIKNPLSALSLHIQLLCERLGKETGDAETAESLDILNTEVKRIGGVLDSFRNYASIHDIGRSPVDVALLIEKLVRLIRLDAEAKGVKIKVDLPTEMVGLIQADEVRLQQVILNLAINGIAAMPSGGVLVFKLSGQDDDICIEVSDTGGGIPDDIQGKIFDPYFTTRSEGTGMGLALCDKIIRQHDGSIDFATDKDGTTFTVRLPKVDAANVSAPSADHDVPTLY